jgi:hypothetical protein
MKMFKSKWLVALICVMSTVSYVNADERHFTYSYEADSVLPKGAWEAEQWITLRAGKGEGEFSRWDFREELEYGISDRLSTAIYLNFNDIRHDLPGEETDVDEFNFDGVSSEWKYMLLSPHLYPIGIMLYFEARYSGEEVELEEKLILQHNFGERWILVGNIIAEEEWVFEEEENEEEGGLEFTAGLSYQLNQYWSIGLEGRNVRVYPDYDEEEFSAWFVGPSVHYGNGKWWVTLTVLPQVSGSPETEDGLTLDEKERVEVRVIAGVMF